MTVYDVTETVGRIRMKNKDGRCECRIVDGKDFNPDSDDRGILLCRLHRSAPELLGALVVMVERMDRTMQTTNALDKAITDKARAAIAKAEGK